MGVKIGRRVACNLISILGLLFLLGVNVWAEQPEIVAQVGDRQYSTVAEAVDNANGQVVTLLADSGEKITAKNDLYLNLNGHTLEGICMDGGILYGIDTTTDDYDCSDGYGKICSFSGEYAQHHKTEIAGNSCRYLAIEESGELSFHRFYLGITHISMRPVVQGLGYKALFIGDEKVVTQLNKTEAFGYTLCLEGNHPVVRWETAQKIESQKTFTLRLNNYDAQHGEELLSANVQIKLLDGTVITSANVSTTLRSCIEKVNENHNTFSMAQLESISDWIRKTPILLHWDVEHILDAEEAYSQLSYYIQYETYEGETDKVLVAKDAKVTVREDFTRTGYSLIGWSYNETNGDEKHLILTPGQDTTVENLTDVGRTVVLRAIWRPYTYTVIYDGNGGEGSMEPTSHLYDTEKSLPMNAFTYPGYQFVGWSSDRNAVIGLYKEGAIVNNLTSINDDCIVLYAVWQKMDVTRIVKTAAFVEDGDIVFLESNAIKKNKTLRFKADITSLGTIILRHGKNAYGCGHLTIDSANVNCYRYNSGDILVSSMPHGLTICGETTIVATVGTNGKLSISITSNGKSFTNTVNWYGSRGNIEMESDSATMKNLTISWECSDYSSDIWFFGDSYFELNSTRWPYYLLKANDNFLLSGFGGANARAMYTDFKTALAHGTPKFAVWCLGMNNGDSESAINPSWKTYTEQFITDCEENGIIPVLTTTPNTPKVINIFKNEYVKNSGYRYIDFASAVGATEKGSGWHEGMLSSDNVHPAALGGEALAKQILIELPEIKQ